MVFDFYADYRDVAETAIRADSWMGVETSGSVFTGVVRVTDNSTLTIEANTDLTFEQDLIVDIGSTLLIKEGATLRFGPGAVLDADGLLTATGVSGNRIIFQRQNSLSGWGGVIIDGHDSELRKVDIDGATVGVEVSALNVTIRQTDLTNNVTGILTDFVNCSGCSNARSTLTLKESEIAGSASIGLYARHADILMEDNEITGSGHNGITIEDADVYAFTGNVVTDSGQADGNGISIISNGNLTMGPTSGYGGNNAVVDNAKHELHVSTGGTLLVGTSAAGGDNSIYKSGNNPSTTARYIRNASQGGGGPYTVMAENTWWNLGSGPPTGAFAGSVDYVPFLTCHPDDICEDIDGGGSSMATRSDGASPSEGGEDWHTWLRREILAARLFLAATPFAEGSAGTVFRLAHLQRLDREDELGERAATMAQLETLRRLLDANPSSSARPVAEAALVAEVRVGLYEESFDAARDLLTGYRSDATGENTQLVLDLASVALLEQTSDYTGALSQLRSIIDALPRDMSDLAAELELSAAVIADRAEQQAGGGMSAPVSAAASASVETETALSYGLAAAYPNPFNPSVAIPFTVPEAANVTVELYDVLGRRVAVVANGLFDAGRHTLRFDGSDLASGVYLLRAVMEAEAGGTARAFTQRLTLLK